MARVGTDPISRFLHTWVRNLNGVPLRPVHILRYARQEGLDDLLNMAKVRENDPEHIASKRISSIFRTARAAFDGHAIRSRTWRSAVWFAPQQGTASSIRPLTLEKHASPIGEAPDILGLREEQPESSELAKLREDVETRDGQIAQLNQEVDRLRAAAESRDGDFTVELQDRIDKLQAALDDCEAQLLEERKIRKEYEAKLKELNETLQAATQNALDWRAWGKEKEQDYQQLEAEFDGAVGAYKQDVADLDRKVRQLKRAIHVLSEDD